MKVEVDVQLLRDAAETVVDSVVHDKLRVAIQQAEQHAAEERDRVMRQALREIGDLWSCVNCSAMRNVRRGKNGRRHHE